ncbi:MAG: DUF11 domain-containing protein [Parachlamydiaceae bacterium]|nr:DUF11 domain-containing protein [Parachlamydiaceae bacterium]
MQKKLGMLTSVLSFCAIALIGIGCSSNSRSNNNNYYDDAAPAYDNYRYADRAETCAPACAPVCAPACAPKVCPPACEPVCRPACEPVCPPARRPACEPVCPPVCRPACEPVCPPACEECCYRPVKCKHPNSNELRCFDFITVRAANPRMCMLGDQYPLDFHVEACADVCDVVVNANLPAGVSLIRSEPEAKVDGRTVTWNFGAMSQGEVICAKVLVKCECEGELCACFCATATPVRFCSLLCAKPILTCHKCGPEEVCPGDPVHYTITVTNKGSCTAEDVVVVDNVPPELEHNSCARTLTYRLGNLEPCQTKTVNVCLTAIKRGKTCNTAIVSACNADSVSCQACTCICCCAIDIEKTGTREVAIGKNADYQIVVRNTGDKDLHEVVVTDTAPSSTSIVSANGATINGNQAIWRLRELKIGESATFNLTLTTCVPGCFTNKVHVDTCEGCSACSEFTTRWKGRPALNICVVSSENPICIGEHTTYTVTLVNQGSESDDNVVVVARFPGELRAVKAYGDANGSISGNTVTFAPINNVRPRQTLTFKIDAEAVGSGDGRVVVEVTSNATKTPIMQQESTIVN